jgi:glycosyltransferase involved in cell wall biosynthesis
MRIGIVTPAPPRSSYGNRVTALRWARILRRLGHRVTTTQRYRGERFDMLIALHARRSHDSVSRFRCASPDAPIVVALTGTDLYRDLQRNRDARKSLELASRIVVLQPKALEDIPSGERSKARVIYQSAKPSRQHRNETKMLRDNPGLSPAGSRAVRRQSSNRVFDACVIGHLRPVKDPFRAAMAARLLPGSSRIQILQVGGAMTAAMARRACEEMQRNSRYSWMGEQTPGCVRRILSRCRVCVLSSKMEGGANVLSEAMVAGVPVLASHIPGSVGILGEGYPGYFKVGDTRGLARLLTRAETDAKFLAGLRRHCRKLAPLFAPQRELRAWSTLLAELS